MPRIVGSLLSAVFGFGAAGATAGAESDVFTLTSPAFKDGDVMPTKYAGTSKSNSNCVGENISPPFAWSKPPEGTKSLVLLMWDPKARSGLGVSHLVIYGIPASTTGAEEGKFSKEGDGYVAGQNFLKLPRYLGPCTPPGTAWHHYTFTLVATDLDPTALEPNLTRDQVIEEINGHGKEATGLVALFKHH